MSAIGKSTMLRIHWRTILKGGTGAVFTPDAIDGDGRTRAKTIRTLLDERVIESVDVDNHSRYRLTPEFVAAAEPGRKPDLALIAGVQSLPDYRLNGLHGAALEESLSSPEYRYVAEHRDEYTFTDPWGKIVDPTKSGAPWDMLVRDDAFTAAVAARKLSIDTERAAKKNLAWGLNRIGALPDGADVSVFKPRSDDLLGASEIAFGDDPGQWEHDSTNVIHQLRERIEADCKALETVVRANAYVAARGGWEKFVAEYRTLLAARVAERVAADKAKAAEPAAGEAGAAS
jgi:hypothetical protein